MKTAIIGTGFLGEQIYKDLAPVCNEIIVTHHNHKKYPNSKKFDFLKDDISKLFDNTKIDIVFLTAMIEFTDNSEALASSMTRFLKACKGSRIVYISSDGIFDGQKGLYKENDKPHSITQYGKNLKICEDLVKKYSDDYLIIRPSYMYSCDNTHLDNRFERVKQETFENKNISRFTDMYKSPLSYNQASEAIVKLALSHHIGTVHVCGERMSVYDFTKEGMQALSISTRHLAGKPMPKEKSPDFLPDTSLDNRLMCELTGIEPLSIKDSFNKYRPIEMRETDLPRKFF